MNSKNAITCLQCGYEYDAGICPLCSGDWETWELQFAPISFPKIRGQIASWLGQAPHPIVLEILATENGLRVRLHAQPGKARGVVKSWASLVHQQTRWARCEASISFPDCQTYVLKMGEHIPNLVLSEGDPFLALGGQLLDQVSPGQETLLRIWILGRDPKLQERVRALASYSYGTGHGVDNDTPNPWGLRLALWRVVLVLGAMIAVIAGGSLSAGWLSKAAGVLGVIGGGVLFLVGALGMQQWMRWRSIPQEVLEACAKDALLKVSFSLCAPSPQSVAFLGGISTWGRIESEWPGVGAYAMPLPAGEIAALITPPEIGEGTGVIDRDVLQEVPAPPPAPALVAAKFSIGVSVATGDSIGVDPDGHGVIAGGSRSGKSSLVYALLQQLIARGEDAPGIFLVDPHLGLADAFLQAVDVLPEPLRSEGVRRLRVITPDQPEIVPLNLLAVPEFTWAGNAIIQVGRRIWDDYWGPRMQAALLALFRLAHAWNMEHPQDRMGFIHVIFAAFNTKWRHSTMAYLDPVDRMGSLALDALLGQLADEHGNWSHGWVTQVVSPVMSKAMALELSPWLFASMHHNRFVDLEKWIKEQAWIVLRLPSGEMGREGARMAAGVVYNVFEAAFRKATLYQPIPFYFVIDELQEIGGGMMLEAMLSEGAKFGARVFALAQSLSMMREVEGFESVVKGLLANTSTQAFFSPDPEDADLIRATLNLTTRYGDTTLDLPSLRAWLRVRIGGRWQPPTLVDVNPIASTNPERVQAMIHEVIAAHPEDYAQPEDWQEQAVAAISNLVPRKHRPLLSELLAPHEDFTEEKGQAKQEDKKGDTPLHDDDPRRLGFSA